ncbi:hypothetical protein ACO2Q9_14820 [Variovorax sp. VNK109]|uniref:hypothetical protein n=1 Tax=Variovorax sp. VNK109 TaxID=3400919 RepID=UPI003BFDAE3E
MDEDSTGFSRQEATRPVRQGANAHADDLAGTARVNPPEPGKRRTDRMEQRERLYGVVREAMVRAGVLSSSYKFKVLSLDPRGGQFIVMMDLARDYGRDSMRLSEIEVMVAQTAKMRFNILVSAVYWRMNDHVAIGVPTARPQPVVPATAAAVAVPVIEQPVNAGRAAPQVHAEPAAARVAVPTPKSGNRHEPLQPDEIEAFKRALMESINNKRAEAAARMEAQTEQALRREEELTQIKAKGISWRGRSTARLTGYEDTEAMEPFDHSTEEGERSPGLSATQFGELH